MVFRKKSKKEEKIDRLQEEIKEFREIEISLKAQLKEQTEKSSATGQRDRAVSLGIIRDKRIGAEETLEHLQETEEDGDKTVKWSEETIRRFVKWLENEGLGWYLYLHMIRFHPNVLERILVEEVPTEEITIEDLEKGIVKNYCFKQNLTFPKEEENEQKENKEKSSD